MTAPLAAAIEALQRSFHGLEEVVRVDVGDDGALGLCARGGGTTRWFVHDADGLVERFPARDESLPLAAWLRAHRDWRVLAYRPGRRAVVLASGEEPAVVLKGHKRGRSQAAAARHAVAEAAARRGAFRTPRLARREAAHEALVFEYLPGSEVELGLESAEAYARLGRGLALFQELPASELEPFDVRDELAVLERWKHKVLQATHALPAGWSEVAARLERRAAGLPEARLGPCHRDLHDRQVHRHDGEIVLFDFDLLCRADVALDAGNLVAHLSWRACQRLHGADPIRARALVGAFLGGLGRAREPDFEPRLAFYTASALLRLALVYRLRPRWSSAVGELVALAGGTLDELISSR